jgi:hypothetical protein
VTAYQASWSMDGGSWTTRTLDDAIRTTDYKLASGRTYAFRVRARDAAGNWSAWATQPDLRLGVFQDTSPSLARKGSWGVSTSSSWSRGSALYSRSSRASVTRALTGRSIAWVAAVGPTRGKARVYVDNVLAATVDLYRSSAAYRRIVFKRSWTTSATHTIRVEVVGTSGRPRVDVDAFIVVR